VKTEHGALTKLQKKELEEWKNSGAESNVVRNLQEVKNIIKSINIGKGE
jgi:hypothetical protein